MNSSINDLHFNALTTLGYTGTLNSMDIQYFQANGATSGSYGNAFKQFLEVMGVSPVSNINDGLWVYLDSLGYVGSMNERLYAWYGATMPAVPIV
jgi:hypothetical protein